MRENKIKGAAVTTVVVALLEAAVTGVLVALLLWFIVSSYEMVNLREEIMQLRVELHDCNSR